MQVEHVSNLLAVPFTLENITGGKSSNFLKYSLLKGMCPSNSFPKGSRKLRGNGGGNSVRAKGNRRNQRMKLF